MGPLNKTGRSTVNQAGHPYCGSEGSFLRLLTGGKASKAVRIPIVVTCLRRENHKGKCRNGVKEW